MRAGDLRHRIELQAVTSTPDGMGGSTDTWSTQETVSAGFLSEPAIERMRAAAPTMIITHGIRMRYYEPIRASWRVKMGARYFSIVSIVDDKERHVQMDLLCREVIP